MSRNDIDRSINLLTFFLLIFNTIFAKNHVKCYFTMHYRRMLIYKLNILINYYKNSKFRCGEKFNYKIGKCVKIFNYIDER